MMKKLFTFLVFSFIISCIFFYKNNIRYEFYKLTYTLNNTNTEKKSKYKKELNVSFVNEFNSLELNNKNDINNAFYTALNNGYEQYNVYCSKTYTNCIEDLELLSSSNNSNIFSTINNFVNPYNSFTEVETKHDSFMNIKWKINKLYNDAEIIMIEETIDNIYNKLINDSMSNVDKIKKIHDYIINNTKYDSKKAEDINNNTYRSNTAFGVLFEQYGICSGYSDTMGLFLDKMNIPNYKIATDKHIWNYVYVDNKWLHLDLTWDDPVTTTGEDVLNHNFFLIDTATLLKLDDTEHNFDSTIYLAN